MTHRGLLARKALSVLVMALTAMGSLTGALLLLATTARAGPCDQVGGVITGDWTITTPQMCTDIVYHVDGSITINAGGSLTLVNGGLSFTQDTTHQYSLTVNAGGSLILDNSVVTTEPRALDAYIKLDFNLVGGNLTMRNGAVLRFPGTFDSSANAVIRMDDSTITGHDRAVVTTWVGATAADDNDDAPRITWTDTTVDIRDSRIEKLYENDNNGLPVPEMLLTISGTTALYVMNSYIGLDFNSDTAKEHNEIRATDSAVAYLFGITIDMANSGTPDQWIPPFAPTAVGNAFHFYRWLDVFVTDSSGVPVLDARVWSRLSPSLSTASYPDAGNGLCPGVRVRAYLGGKTCTGSTAFNATGPNGRALIPLNTDRIDTATAPNAESFGNYQLTASYLSNTASDSVFYDPYPIITAGTNTKGANMTFTGLTLPKPDLYAGLSATFSPATPLAGDDVAVSVTIYNAGPGRAGTFRVRFSDNYQGRTTVLEDQTITQLDAGNFVPLSLNWPDVTPGDHSIRVDVDIGNDMPETIETNNRQFYSIRVTPIGPDLSVGVSFSPSPGYAGNTVSIQATVQNSGGANATNFLVEFKLGSLETDPYASITVPTLENSTIVSVDWIPTTPGSYNWYAIVDPDDRIPEDAPYSDADNVGNATLTVIPAPNLQVYSEDLRTSDPYPLVGDTVTLTAIVRNTGQDPAPGSDVDFYIDDQFIQRRPVIALGVGASVPVTTTLTWTASGCGFHTLRAEVDPLNSVVEGSIYETDNSVTSNVQVYPSSFVSWAVSRTISGVVVPVATNLEISAPVSITDGGIYVSQQSEACNRALVKITGGGSLTLVNSSVSSNWPLNILVSGTGQLVTRSGSVFRLDADEGAGTLRSVATGILDVRDTTVDGDVLAAGRYAYFRSVTFEGSSVYIAAAEKSEIWDADVESLTDLQLRSDDANVGTVDFDIRNTSFGPGLTQQLRFGGRQWAQLTSVGLSLPPGTDWWTGMISQNAKVTLYWWLRVEAVDGTGTLLEGADPEMRVLRFDATTLSYLPVSPAAAGDIYLISTPVRPAPWPVTAPLGYILYRAAAEDRFLSPSSQWVNASYQATAQATIDNIDHFPDANLTRFLQADTTIRLVFSGLTPELRVSVVQVYRDPETVPRLLHPLNVPLNVTATVNNEGSVNVRNVVVSFFAIDVDVNGDGRMDTTKSVYIAADQWIGDVSLALIGPASSEVAWILWTAEGVSESTRRISVVVDAPLTSNPLDDGEFHELDETNNIRTHSLTLHIWPDLNILSVATEQGRDPVVQNPTPIQVVVRNDGTADATQANLTMYIGATPVAPTIVFTLSRGASTTLFLTWTPTAPGVRSVRLVAESRNITGVRNTDYNWGNNVEVASMTVLTQPDIAVLPADQTPPAGPTQGVPFTLNVTIRNLGDTDATNFTVSVFLDGDTDELIGFATDVFVARNDASIQPVTVTVPVDGTHALTIFADSTDVFGTLWPVGRIIEGDEGNNWANVTVTLAAPAGYITIDPVTTAAVEPGTNLNVQGYVLDDQDRGLSGVTIHVELQNAQGQNTSAWAETSSVALGFWRVTLSVPGNLANGVYTIRATSATGSQIVADTAEVTVETRVPWWLMMIGPLPLIVWLLIIIIAVVVIIGVTLYFKVFGLGRMVECGECGSFIPEDSTSCPKCGVEFEKEMAKCSNCQAWIPVDVKQCPECGVEFATGKVEMADYQEKMRMQYDEVVAKFREESQRALGRALTEREFQEWWRKQPTFVTFEDWLREEEEMRKMGSKPCPACNTLNSVTATVCHKCGTYLKEERRPPTGGAPPPTPRAEVPAAGPAPAEAGAPPAEAVPRKVVRKPAGPTPVVQKKVIKRPVGEQQQEGGEQTTSEGKPEEEEF